MIMRLSFLSLLLSGAMLSIILAACTPTQAEPIPDTDHIIILAFDGWGSSSFESAEMPFLKGMIPNSAWSVHKRSVLPSSSACNWASMFKGAGPEAHGYIEWDTRTPVFDVVETDEKGNFPSFFSLYRKHFPSREMGYLYQWEGMKFILDTEDFNYLQEFPVSNSGSDMMKDAAISYILDKRPSVAAFIWDYPDKVGHMNGWYSSEYMRELTHIDSIIEEIVNACSIAGILENTLFVITSDHGGHETTHGSPRMSDLETPFIMFGKRIRAGEIRAPFLQYDVAAILADYAHFEQPAAWRGMNPDPTRFE